MTKHYQLFCHAQMQFTQLNAPQNSYKSSTTPDFAFKNMASKMQNRLLPSSIRPSRKQSRKV